MNSAPLPFLKRTIEGPALRNERPTKRTRVTYIPPEVHAARAFAKLAGINLDELGVTGRPPCTHSHTSARADEPQHQQTLASGLQRGVQWAKRLGKGLLGWLKAKIR